MARFGRFTSLFLAGATALFSAPPVEFAQAADVIRSYAPYQGPCAEGWVLRSISNRFRYQVTHVPNLPDVGIVEFRDIRENRFHPASERWPIARLYCEANVVLSDGYSRNVWYLIEGGMGFASIGDNVEFCVAGFDRWHVYNSGCRVLR